MTNSGRIRWKVRQDPISLSDLYHLTSCRTTVIPDGKSAELNLKCRDGLSRAIKWTKVPAALLEILR